MLCGDGVGRLCDCVMRTTIDDKFALPSCYYFVFAFIYNAKKELISCMIEARCHVPAIKHADCQFFAFKLELIRSKSQCVACYY